MNKLDLVVIFCKFIALIAQLCFIVWIFFLDRSIDRANKKIDALNERMNQNVIESAYYHNAMVKHLTALIDILKYGAGIKKGAFTDSPPPEYWQPFHVFDSTQEIK